MVMTTITSDTSIMDILGGGASAKFFGLLEDNNELMEDMDDRDELAFKRQEKVLKEFESMSDAVEDFQNGIKESIKQSTTRLKDGITNPINKMRNDSITAYTNFTESIGDMKDGVSQKLTDMKEGFTSNITNLQDGFSTKVDSLKTGFTDAVAMTNSVLDTMSVKMEAFSNLPTEQQIMLAGKVVADGVMDTISAIPDAINNGMDKLNKGISAVGGFVKSSSGYLKGLFTKSEESDDVGGTSGLADTGKPKDDSPDTGGIGSMIGSLMPKGLLKTFGKTGKMLGKLGRLAGKLALPLVAIMGIFDFVGGVQNAEEIVGKPQAELSNLEKAGAGLSSLLSGLTLGLIDSKAIYSEGSQMISSITGFASDLYGKLPDGVKQYTDKIGDFLFSSDGGVFSSVGTLFNDVIDGIAEGDWGGVALDLLTGSFKMMFGGDGILANTVSGVFDLLPNSFQESITEFADTLFGWFDKIKNMASDMIPDSIKNFFGDVAESDTGKAIGKGISATKSFFGFDDDTKDSKITERKSIGDVAGVGTVITGNANQESRIGENNGRAKAITKRKHISENEIVTTRKSIKDSDTATKKSKAVMNRKQDVAPVIIQQPAPAQRQGGSGKTLNTSTTIGDTELAVMNSNMMD
jgi:hypothetical protein